MIISTPHAMPLRPTQHALTCLLVVALLSSALTVTAVTYSPTVGNFPMTILSPPSLAGIVMYQPDEFTPGLPHMPALVATLVIPSLQEYNMTRIGCNNTWNSAFSYDGVTPIQGNVLLLPRGTCAFYNKVVNGQVQNPAAVIVYDSLTATLTTIRSYWDNIYIQGGSGTPAPNVSGLSITMNDGLALYNAIVNGTTITVSIPGTGNITAGDRAVLGDLLANVNFTNESPAALNSALYSSLRNWTVYELNRPDKDPCLNNFAGIWCIAGRVVMMRWLTLMPVGIIPQSIGNLTGLRVWMIESSGLTDLGGPGFCQLITGNLTIFELTNTLTLTHLPNCNATINVINNNSVSVLRRFEIISVPIVHFPAWVITPSLSWLTFSLTSIDHVPARLFTSVPLTYLDLSSNSIYQQLDGVTFSNATLFNKLVYLDLSTNFFYGYINATDFSNMPNLIKFSIGSNNYQGVLPNFASTTKIQYMDISSSALVGSIPTSWMYFTALVELHAQHNYIYTPTTALTSIKTLSIIDLSYNNLVSDYYSTGFTTPDALTFITNHIATTGLTFINLGYNQIGGTILTGAPLNSYTSITQVLLNNNNISGPIPNDLFPVGLTTLDLSYNAFTGPLPTTAPGTKSRQLNLQGNPYMSPTVPLPAYIKLSGSYVLATGGSYSCPEVKSTVANLAISLDPFVFSYTNCTCSPGEFPAPSPPYCLAIPLQENLIDDTTNSAGNSAVTFAVPYVTRSFTDAWYGNNRLLQGLDTTWVINGTGANATYVDTTPFVVNGNNNQETSEIKRIRLYIHVDLAVFNSAHDMIIISQIDIDGNTELIASYNGLSTQLLAATDPSSWPAQVMTPSYIALYNSSYNTMVDRAVLEVDVVAPVASVEMVSRHVSGLHMFISYDYISSCPASAFVTDSVTGTYEWSQSQQTCNVVLPIYTISVAMKVVIYVFTAVNVILIAVAAVLIILNRNYSGIKGQAVTFLLAVLGFLALLAAGSTLYGIVGTSDYICSLRVWLTCLPLTAILAILLGKTRRVYSIFAMQKLTVKRVTNADIWKGVLIMCALQCMTLSVFTALGMSVAAVAEGSSSSVTANHLVQECNQQGGFTIWVSLQIVAIGGFIFWAAIFAFLARNLPADFNESLHIAIALAMLGLLGIIFVPLDILIQSIPEATMLIQGVGQNTLVLFLTVILYGPKMYYIATNRTFTTHDTTTPNHHQTADNKINETGAVSTFQPAYANAKVVPAPINASRKADPTRVQPQPKASPHSGKNSQFVEKANKDASANSPLLNGPPTPSHATVPLIAVTGSRSSVTESTSHQPTEQLLPGAPLPSSPHSED